MWSQRNLYLQNPWGAQHPDAASRAAVPPLLLSPIRLSFSGEIKLLGFQSWGCWGKNKGILHIELSTLSLSAHATLANRQGIRGSLSEKLGLQEKRSILENSSMLLLVKSHPLPSSLQHLFFDFYHHRLILSTFGLHTIVMTVCVYVFLYGIIHST